MAGEIYIQNVRRLRVPHRTIDLRFGNNAFYPLPKLIPQHRDARCGLPANIGDKAAPPSRTHDARHVLCPGTYAKLLATAGCLRDKRKIAAGAVAAARRGKCRIVLAHIERANRLLARTFYAKKVSSYQRRAARRRNTDRERTARRRCERADIPDGPRFAKRINHDFISRSGWTVPTSLFTCMIDTTTVRSFKASFSATISMTPSLLTGSL